MTCEMAFGLLGLDPERYVRTDERYRRPNEVDGLCGDESNAELAAAVLFADPVRIMLKAHLAEAGINREPTVAGWQAKDGR